MSGKSFDLIYNKELDILETTPQPKGDDLLDYYKSEDYISHTDAKRNIFEYVYHSIRQLALKKKLKLINSFQTSEKKLLDIGCGTGDFLAIAKRNNWEIKGIEPNTEARKIANAKTNNAVFDTNELPKFKDNSFDCITLWHVLEHLPNLEEQIIMFKRLLKPDGRLIIAVPNFKSYDAQHYKNYWAAFDAPRHLWHFSRDGIKNIFSQYDFKIVSTTPMFFDAYYVSLLSEKYKTGFMNPFKAFWIGWVSNGKAKRSGEYSSLIYNIKAKNTI